MRTGRLLGQGLLRSVSVSGRCQLVTAYLGCAGLTGVTLACCGLCGNLRSLQICLLAANDGDYFTGCVHGCLQAAVSLDAPGAVSLDCDLAVCVLAAPGAVSLYSYLALVALNGPAAVLGDNNVALNGGGGGCCVASESLDSALVPFSSDSTLEELPSESLASTDALPSAPTFTSAELPSPSLALTVTLPSLSTFTSAVAEAEAAEVVAAEDALADAVADAVAEADADAVAVVVVEEDWGAACAQAQCACESDRQNSGGLLHCGGDCHCFSLWLLVWCG